MSAQAELLAGLMTRAAARCGNGCAQRITELAGRYPDPLVWEQALVTMDRYQPRQPLNYLARVLQSAAQEQASLRAGVHRHTPAAYPAPNGFVSWDEYYTRLQQARPWICIQGAPEPGGPHD